MSKGEIPICWIGRGKLEEGCFFTGFVCEEEFHRQNGCPHWRGKKSKYPHVIADYMMENYNTIQDENRKWTSIKGEMSFKWYVGH